MSPAAWTITILLPAWLSDHGEPLVLLAAEVHHVHLYSPLDPRPLALCYERWRA